MKPTAILVNAARGPLVDEAALAEALRENRIAGAGLDVLEVEPPAPDNPLLTLGNVVLSPHTAGNTVEAARQLALASADIVIAVLSGRRPEGLLNPEAWEKRRR
jgi:D-3-phosphoglycerate dehydrogenase